MKKFLVLVLTILLAAAFMSTALAVPPGKVVDYKDGKTGPVQFDGKKHADAGNKCNDCHPKVFQMKTGASKITMKDMREGKNCGTCHNGEKAFKVNVCKKCHIKKKKVIQGC
ncbi:MAG: cytochrome C [Nitrospirota bacterium]|nr:MAG: cytochrome C [Nitrospirota bacterium]